MLSKPSTTSPGLVKARTSGVNRWIHGVCTRNLIAGNGILACYQGKAACFHPSVSSCSVISLDTSAITYVVCWSVNLLTSHSTTCSRSSPNIHRASKMLDSKQGLSRSASGPRLYRHPVYDPSRLGAKYPKGLSASQKVVKSHNPRAWIRTIAHNLAPPHPTPSFPTMWHRADSSPTRLQIGVQGLSTCSNKYSVVLSLIYPRKIMRQRRR